MDAGIHCSKLFLEQRYSLYLFDRGSLATQYFGQLGLLFLVDALRVVEAQFVQAGPSAHKSLP